MITSTGSSQVKHVISLLSKAKARREDKEYVVEGIRMVSEVPSDALVKVYMSETFAGNNGNAYGDKAEIVSDNVYNPKVIRSTMGSIFRVPYLITDNLLETIEELKNNGIKVYAAHLDGKGAYTDMDYTGGTAFMIGNEGNGLTDEAAAKADCFVKIPMSGKVESLNAAIACTVLAFEAARQRR